MSQRRGAWEGVCPVQIPSRVCLLQPGPCPLLVPPIQVPLDSSPMSVPSPLACHPCSCLFCLGTFSSWTLPVHRSTWPLQAHVLSHLDRDRLLLHCCPLSPPACQSTLSSAVTPARHPPGSRTCLVDVPRECLCPQLAAPGEGLVPFISRALDLADSETGAAQL